MCVCLEIDMVFLNRRYKPEAIYIYITYTYCHTSIGYGGFPMPNQLNTSTFAILI